MVWRSATVVDGDDGRTSGGSLSSRQIRCESADISAQSAVQRMARSLPTS